MDINPVMPQFGLEGRVAGQTIADHGGEYSAFLDTLVEIPPDLRDIRDMCAYPLWLCRVVQDDGSEVIVENMYGNMTTNSWLMSVSSLAFSDAIRAVGMILAFPVDLPPVAGVAAARLLDDKLLDDNMLDCSPDAIRRLYSALEAVATRCIRERSVGADYNEGGLCFYTRRHENGVKKSPAFFNAGERVLAPDLNAYMIIVCETLARLASLASPATLRSENRADGESPGYANTMGTTTGTTTGIMTGITTGKRGSGANLDNTAIYWETRAKSMTERLVAELWNGEDFIGKNAYTGEVSGVDDFLSLVPIILGNRLPEDVFRKLASKIETRTVNNSAGLPLVCALYDAGETAAAKDIAAQIIADARSGGIRKSFYGAALLALAHKVLW